MSLTTSAQTRKAQLQKLLAQRVLARRRLLQFTQMTHPSYSAGWVHDDICRRLERFSQEVAEKKSPRLMLLMPPRHGKLLANDTMVLTSEGWKTHGDLVKGDKVMGLKGWTEVIGVSRPGVADCEVTTSAGTRIKCHRHHEWGVDEYASWDDPVAEGARPTPAPRKHKRSYRYNVVETLDFLAHKAKNGHMRGAGAPTMRRFYLPSPDFTVYDLSVRRMLQYRRKPRNGGRLAIDDVTELEEPVPGKCIQVAAEDGIYLVTRDFVPTHNSELASIRFPAWHLGHNPTHELINVGYNLELPMKFSRKVREVMRDPQYKAIFPDSQLDPDSQSVEAWNTTKGGGFTAAGVGGGITGKGCFRTSTHVHTRNGILPISDVRVGDEVLGYDHAEQRPQWTRVLAVHAGRLAGPARKHGSIWCTPDHELFVPGRGYVPAGEALAQGLPILRWGESSARCVVSSLSDGAGAGDEGSAGLRAVQQPVPSSGGRAHQAHGSWGWEPHVLFGRVFPGLAQGAGRTATRLVRELQRAVGEAVPAALLFAGVLPRSTTAADGGVQRGVSVVEEAGAGARRASVRDDGQDADARGAPYRPRPYEQRADEPYFSLEDGARVLSFTPGWSAGRVAELVRGEGEVTVDLQTTAGNLFVEGVLAHNCHILIIDDPIKNQEEADSILVRDKLWDWYQSTAYTRLAPGGGVLCIETFWHDDDLAGRLQQAMSAEDEADQFEIIRYPALSEHWEYRNELTQEILRLDAEIAALEPHQTLLRPKDFCLHEDRYPTEALRRIRANLQPRIWSALYQQNPVPDEGMYFKKEYFRYQKTLPSPNNLRIYTAWDFAIGEKQQNDWTVGATVLQDETDTIYVLEIFRMKGDSFQIVEAMLDTALRWGSIPTTGYLVGAEDGQIWRAIEPLLKKRMGERRQYPPYEVMRPMTDKLARARPLQGRMQQGRVVFPEGAGWLPQAEQELLRFPAGAHDDVVDALAWAAQLCMGKEPPRLAVPPPLPSWRDKLSIMGGQGSHMTA